MHTHASLNAPLHRADLVKREIVFAALAQQTEDHVQRLLAVLSRAHGSDCCDGVFRGSQQDATRELRSRGDNVTGTCVDRAPRHGIELRRCGVLR